MYLQWKSENQENLSRTCVYDGKVQSCFLNRKSNHLQKSQSQSRTSKGQGHLYLFRGGHVQLLLRSNNMYVLTYNCLFFWKTTMSINQKDMNVKNKTRYMCLITSRMERSEYGRTRHFFIIYHRKMIYYYIIKTIENEGEDLLL